MPTVGDPFLAAPSGVTRHEWSSVDHRLGPVADLADHAPKPSVGQRDPRPPSRRNSRSASVGAMAAARW